jgi:hypothetical protein
LRYFKFSALSVRQMAQNQRGAGHMMSNALIHRKLLRYR